MSAMRGHRCDSICEFAGMYSHEMTEAQFVQYRAHVWALAEAEAEAERPARQRRFGLSLSRQDFDDLAIELQRIADAERRAYRSA